MTSANTETIEILSDATAMVYRPDGLQVAVATLNGQITFFNPVTGQQTGNIDGRGDLAVGRSDTDLVTPKKSKAFFTAMSYSADGEFILGMVSHKMSLITIFGHNYKNFLFFIIITDYHEKITTFNHGSHLELNCKF